LDLGSRPTAARIVLERGPQQQERLDLRLGVPERASLLRRAVPHLRGWTHAGRRHQHEERDAIRPGRDERRDPRALAEPPKADAIAIDVGAAEERLDDGLDVAGLIEQRDVIAPAVEPRDRDAGRRQDRLEMPEQVVIARAVVRGVPPTIAGNGPAPGGSESFAVNVRSALVASSRSDLTGRRGTR